MSRIVNLIFYIRVMYRVKVLSQSCITSLRLVIIYYVLLVILLTIKKHFVKFVKYERRFKRLDSLKLTV